MSESIRKYFNGLINEEILKNRSVENTLALLALTIANTKGTLPDRMRDAKAQVAVQLRKYFSGDDTIFTDSDQIVLLGSSVIPETKDKVSTIVVASGDEIKFEVVPTNSTPATSVDERCNADGGLFGKLDVLARIKLDVFKRVYLANINLPPEPLPPAA